MVIQFGYTVSQWCTLKGCRVAAATPEFFGGWPQNTFIIKTLLHVEINYRIILPLTAAYY